MKISILLPTKARRNNLIRLFNSIKNTARNINNIEISMRCDYDDSVAPVVYEEFKKSLDLKFKLGESQLDRSIFWKDALSNATGEIFMSCGDDIVFETNHWDDIVINEFLKYEDRILFLFGNDGYQFGNMGAHNFVHKNWVKALGYYLPTGFKSYFQDNWIDDVARKANRRKYMPDLKITHMHYVVGKAPKDEIYNNIQDTLLEDKEQYMNREDERIRDANILLKFIEEYQNEKD